MPILVGQTEPCEAENVTGEDAETSESTRPQCPEGTKPCDAGCKEVGDGGDSASDGPSVASAESGARKKSDGHHSGSDVCTGEEGMATSLAEFDVLRFRNSFLKVVEELRMRRLIDVENEERIKDLVARTHELEEKLREEQSRYAAVIEGHSQEEQEMRKQYDEQMKQMEDEKAKYGLSIEGKERELKALKDEIRVLHLAKYNLEKKVQEQDRQLQLQTSSRDSHLSQMSQLEQKCSTAFKQAAEATEQMERIDANVKQAIKLNQKLQYMNSHQQCTIEACRRELETCRQELLEAKVQLAGQQGTNGGGEDHGRVKTSEQELKMQVELNHQLQAQLLGLREEHQAILQQLKEAHNLIQRHVETSVKLSASKDEMDQEVANLTEKSRELGEQLSTSMEQCQSMQVKYNTETKEWEEKCADIEHRLKTLQVDYSALQASHDKQEEAKVAAEEQLKSKTSDGKEARQTLEEEVKQLGDEVHKLKERSLKESQEWSEKAEKLETALQQSEQLLTEREKLLEMKEKQYCELEAKYKKELQVRAVFNPVNPPATPVDCVQDSDTDQPSCLSHIQGSKVPAEENKCHTTSTVNTQVADGLSILEPPGSPMLSPDVISISQDFTKLPSPEQITNTEEPMEVTVHASKNLSPRIHLEKIHLPLVKHEGKEGTVTKTTHQDESVSSGCPDVGTVQISAQSESLVDKGVAPNLTDNKVNATLKREAEETFRDSEARQFPPKKPRISITSDTGTAPVVSNEPSAVECSQASESNKEPHEGRTQSSDGASQQIGGSHHSQSPQSKSSISAPTGHHKEGSKSNSDPPSCGNQSTSHSQPNLTAATKLEPCPGKDASFSVNLPSSWKLETPKPKSLRAETNPPRAYHQVIHSEADKQPKSSLKNKAKTLTASLAMPSSATQKEGFKDHSRHADSSDQVGENSMQLSLALPLVSSNTFNNSICVPQASKSNSCQETLKEECTNGPRSSSVSHDTGSEFSANTPNKDNSLLVVFSEDDEEEKDDEKSNLLSSQLNRQIDRVQTFLKMDRLRRPKSIK